MSTLRKLALLTSLYIAQGLPFGFFTQALPVMMREKGLSLEAIGMSSLLALPWAVKLVWAPFVDKHYFPNIGRRRSWIIPVQILTIATVIVLALVEPSSFVFLMILVFIVNFFSSTQDIATDGLAVELLSPKERGWGNGIQVAGYRFGMIIGGGALLVLFDRSGWRMTFGSMAVILFLTTLPILKYQEKSSAHPAEHAAIRWRDIFRFFHKPGAFGWLLCLILYKSGDAFATQMLRPMFVDQGYTLSEIGSLLGTVGFSFGLIGSLVGGFLVGRMGRRRSLLVFAVLQTLTILAYHWTVKTGLSKETVYIIAAAEHLCGGLATVALFTAMMDRCEARTAASDYTLQACFVVISTGLFSAVSGLSAGQFGYAVHFVISAVLSLAGLLSIYLNFKPAIHHQDPDGEAKILTTQA